MNNIGAVINQYLELNGMSQKDLADKCKITAVTLNRYISGLRTPKASTLEKIANALDIPVSAFYEDKPKDISVYRLISDMIKINVHNFTNEQKFALICELTK